MLGSNQDSGHVQNSKAGKECGNAFTCSPPCQPVFYLVKAIETKLTLLYELYMTEKISNNHGKLRMVVENNGSKKSLQYPFSCNHLSLMEYSQYWNLEEIILFEKMIVLYRSFGMLPFTYQQNRLIKELHITRDKLENARNRLKADGILIETNSGHGRKIMYSINNNRVLELVPEIYSKQEKDNRTQDQFIGEIRDFYNYYFSEGYLSDKIKKGKFKIFPDDNKNSGDTPLYKIDENTGEQIS